MDLYISNSYYKLRQITIMGIFMFEGFQGAVAVAPSVANIYNFFFTGRVAGLLWAVVPALALRGNHQMLQGCALGSMVFTMFGSIIPRLPDLFRAINSFSATSMSTVPGSSIAILGYLGAAFIWNLVEERLSKDVTNTERRGLSWGLAAEFFNYLPLAVLAANVGAFFEKSMFMPNTYVFDRTVNYAVLGGLVYTVGQISTKIWGDKECRDNRKPPIIDMYEPIKDFFKANNGNQRVPLPG